MRDAAASNYAEPMQLTPAEQLHDDLLRFENRDRYVLQSQRTRVNDPAPPPPRAPLLTLVR